MNARSRERLRGVQPDLVAVVERAYQIGPPFIVTEGMRTLERQRQLVAAGASRTLNSRHLTGHAADLAALVDNQVRWDWPLYLKLAESMRTASLELKVPVRWGGSWKLLSGMTGPITNEALSKTFPDGPHFELDAKAYP